MLPIVFCFNVLLLLLDVGVKLSFDLGVSTMWGCQWESHHFTST